MSEPGPESIPTSADPRSKRPVKRRAVTPLSEQANQIETLFRDPSREIQHPNASKQRSATSLAPPPEIVANVQGSSAGAGSGEFHVYKASRRREYERLRLMQAEVDKEKGDQSWEKEMEETKRRDKERTEKNRRKREKRMAAKKGNKRGAASGDGKGNADIMDGVEGSTNGSKPGAKNEDKKDRPDTRANVETQEETPGVIIHDED